MPPAQQPNDSTRRVIDIAFAMPEGTLRAMEQLTQQMVSMQASVNAMLSTTPEGRAAGAKAMSAAMPGSATRSGRVIPSGSGAFASLPPTVAAEYPGTTSAHGELPSTPPEAPVRTPDAPMSRGLLGRLDRRINKYGARERAQTARRSGYGAGALVDYEESSVGTGADPIISGSGRPSSGASMPGGDDPSGMSPGLQAVYSDKVAFERSQEGFRMPQFGELTLQDKLRMAANAATSSAYKAYERQRDTGMNQGLTGADLNQFTQGTAVNRGRTGALLNMAANNVTQAQVVGRNVQQAFNWGQGMQAQGIESGYDAGGVTNIPGTQIGFRNPLDFFNQGSAFREAMNQRINVQRLRLRGGITGGQAQEIVGSLSGLGWTGEQGQHMAFDAVAPLVQQGLNPGVTSQMFDQGIRNGTTSLAQLRQTLDDLGPSAKAAHMSLTEYQQGLDAYANQLQTQGATYGQGVATGKDLSTAYGMTPQAMGAFTQSPLVQAMGAVKFGALPQQFGALGTAGIGVATGSAVQRAMSLFQPIAKGRPGQPGYISGQQNQETMAAAALGVPYEVLHNYNMTKKIAPNILQGNTDVDKFANQTKALHAADAAHADAKVTFHEGPNKPGDWVPANQSTPGAVNRGGKWMIKATVGGAGGRYEMADAGYQDAVSQTAGSRKNVVDDMVRAARQAPASERAGLFKTINDIKGEKDSGKFGKGAKNFFSDAAKSAVEATANQDKVQVQFTGAAAKYFQQVEGKLPKEFRDADKGGPARNATAASAVDTNYIDLLKTYTGG